MVCCATTRAPGTASDPGTAHKAPGAARHTPTRPLADTYVLVEVASSAAVFQAAKDAGRGPSVALQQRPSD
jgi:hypothetical protein